VNVSPTVTTDYCYVITDANGCATQQACVPIHVYQPLNILALNGGTICLGDSLMLMAAGMED
jgi:hypothetical protein